MSNTVIGPLGQTVHEYVERVRAELSDLPTEDVDELTGGLEADLAERAAELPAGAGLTASFGAPDAYAAELRAAADLPPRSLADFVAPSRNIILLAELAVREWRDAAVAKRPWLQDLRPVWWVGRGIVLGGVLDSRVFHGSSRALTLIVMVVGALGSFLWSRGRERAAGSWPNRLTIVANVFALLLSVPIASSLLMNEVRYVTVTQPAPEIPRDGAFVNGQMASNLYAYDAEGNRIDRVRLFNQYGQGVTVPSQALLSMFNNLGEAPPLDAKGDLTIPRGVFPVRWGSRTGWEASDGQWEPPVKISALPEPAKGPAPDVSASPSP